MRVFMSYASEQKHAAEAIAFSLRSRGHQVFLDRDDLPEGSSYDEKIERAINRTDLVIYLITPESVAPGRYTLTELRFARNRWRSPANRILPVMLSPTPISEVPAFLKAVTILEPAGNVTAEVAYAAEKLRGVERGVNVAAVLAGVGALVAMIAGIMPVVDSTKSWLAITLPGGGFDKVALENGVLLALLFCGIVWWLADTKWWKFPIVALAALVGWVACVWLYMHFADNFRILSVPIERELSNILEAIPQDKQTDLNADINALQNFIKVSRDNSIFWSSAIISAMSGTACFVLLMVGLAIVEPGFRAFQRWVLGILVALVASAGAVLALGPAQELTGRRVFWFVTDIDVFFAFWYLPWLVSVTALVGFWLVRGQET